MAKLQQVIRTSCRPNLALLPRSTFYQATTHSPALCADVVKCYSSLIQRYPCYYTNSQQVRRFTISSARQRESNKKNTWEELSEEKGIAASDAEKFKAIAGEGEVIDEKSKGVQKGEGNDQDPAGTETIKDVSSSQNDSATQKESSGVDIENKTQALKNKFLSQMLAPLNVPPDSVHLFWDFPNLISQQQQQHQQQQQPPPDENLVQLASQIETLKRMDLQDFEAVEAISEELRGKLGEDLPKFDWDGKGYDVIIALGVRDMREKGKEFDGVDMTVEGDQIVNFVFVVLGATASSS
ncbi:MAG: hypothetical protein M1834_008426 [Cirrosporium novae-zelandiae]|nr:MAG: hypothetical protein M1834_008426 [Cirrosporium novae-zelandiae]